MHEACCGSEFTHQPGGVEAAQMRGLWVPQARAETNQLSSLTTRGHLSLSRKRTRQMVSHTRCAWKECGNFPCAERMSFCCHLIAAVLGTPHELLLGLARAHHDVRLTSLSLLLNVLLLSSPLVACAILLPLFPPFLPSFIYSFIH